MFHRELQELETEQQKIFSTIKVERERERNEEGNVGQKKINRIC